MSDKPLSGLRVLDLTRLLPGPMCTLHLADLGADVVKIEDAAQGDYARWMGSVRKTTSGYFLAVNRNKRGLALDLKQADGRAVFLDLARRADAVVESFRPGVVDRLGIGFEAARAVNPGIVYCSISGYGQSGPYRERAGHDLNYCSYAGITEQTGLAEGPPAPGNFQIADLAGGALAAALGLLAALLDAARSGRGRHVDISMTDCALAHSVMPLLVMLGDGRPAPRGRDFLSGGLPGYAVYRTRDGRYLALAALEPKFWSNFCHAVGRPDWVGRYLGPAHGRPEAEVAALRAELVALFASADRAHWCRLLEPADCCASPVLDLAEAMDDPQLRARGMFVTAEHPLEGPVLQFACPVRMSDFQFTIERPAPGHGQHSRQLLVELGYGPDRIEHLLRSGAVHQEQAPT